MFTLTSTHKAEVKRLMAEIAKSGVQLTTARDGRAIAQRQLHHVEAERDAARIERDTAQRERDEALGELRALKAVRQRCNANLAEANARRRADALARKPANDAAAPQPAA